ncbi:MAG TPA: GNAT family N-acetyltransferase [Anaerolineae bacterium]|nr:GNAT family N-acetyltransferase [Anaerolineae bacterium]
MEDNDEILTCVIGAVNEVRARTLATVDIDLDHGYNCGMSEFTIRPAQADEEPTIRSMIRAERLDPFNVHWPNFLVAEADERIIGVGQIKPYPNGRELGSLVVMPEYRQNGAGGAIIHALIARESGPLMLFCLAFRERYYAKFGFRRIGLRDLPAAFKFKYALGSLFTRLMRHRLIVMKR